MAYQIPQNVRAIVVALAEVALPVQAWVKQKKPPRYDQFIPALSPVPWRPTGADPNLSTANFDIVRFVEILADNDEANIALAPRWNAIKADPTKYFQNRLGQSPAQWRAGRQGLKPDATKFGAFEPDSSNFAFVTQKEDGTVKDAVSRMGFYDSCWPPLEDAYRSNPPTSPASWGFFRDTLRTDQFASWPTSRPVRSSAFIKQFTIDVLNACLGQKNQAIAAGGPLWQRAVLIEVGENRHVGNCYTVQQATQAVETFTKTI
jgi:hypothetical protein